MAQLLLSGAKYEGEHGSKDVLLSALFWPKYCTSYADINGWRF